MIWEALAAIGVGPERACSLVAAQGFCVSVDQAAQQLAAAKRRNTLRLIKI